MLRLISFGFVAMSLVMISGCKMCASYTDITGSPVANAMSSDYHRAGSQLGGYSGGGYYVDGYQSTANPQSVFDSEFSRASRATQNTQTSQYPITHGNSSSLVVPAVINSQYPNY